MQAKPCNQALQLDCMGNPPRNSKQDFLGLVYGAIVQLDPLRKKGVIITIVKFFLKTTTWELLHMFCCYLGK